MNRLYSKKILLTETKYNHLQELKQIIEKDFQVFYDTLSFKEIPKESGKENEKDLIRRKIKYTVNSKNKNMCNLEKLTTTNIEKIKNTTFNI